MDGALWMEPEFREYMIMMLPHLTVVARELKAPRLMLN